jgi:hypothetical protein
MSTADLKLSVAVLQPADHDEADSAVHSKERPWKTKSSAPRKTCRGHRQKTPISQTSSYVANGKQTGFWLRRITWGTTCAQVVHVGELSEKPPYYGNPVVRADIYDLWSGEPKQRNVSSLAPAHTRPGDK